MVQYDMIHHDMFPILEVYVHVDLNHLHVRVKINVSTESTLTRNSVHPFTRTIHLLTKNSVHPLTTTILTKTPPWKRHTNICVSMSTGSSYDLSVSTWRGTTLPVPFSPSEAYYPLLNEMSNSWIVLRKFTNPPSTTPLVVEARYKSSFYHVLSGRVQLLPSR